MKRTLQKGRRPKRPSIPIRAHPGRGCTHFQQSFQQVWRADYVERHRREGYITSQARCNIQFMAGMPPEPHTTACAGALGWFLNITFILRGAFFCCAKRKRPSDSPKGKGACCGAGRNHRLCLPPKPRGGRPRTGVAAGRNMALGRARPLLYHAAVPANLLPPDGEQLQPTYHSSSPLTRLALALLWVAQICGVAWWLLPGIVPLTIPPYKQSPPQPYVHNPTPTAVKPRPARSHPRSPLRGIASGLAAVAAHMDAGAPADLRRRTWVAAGCGVPTGPARRLRGIAFRGCWRLPVLPTL